MAREYYRIVRGERSILDDFKSAKELGKPIVSRYVREWAESVSVHDDLAYSRAHARVNRMRLGRFIVRIVVPDDGSVDVAQTTRDRHHHSIYAPANVIAALVVGDAIPVEDD